MFVSKLSAPVSFSARTTVTAPETMLRKSDAEYFAARGNDIGYGEDIINIRVGDKYVSKTNPDRDFYNVSIKTKFGDIKTKTTSVVPVDKFTPKNYLDKIFNEWEADNFKRSKPLYLENSLKKAKVEEEA